MKQSKRKRSRKVPPDWFGCGKAITQESWDAFLKAQRDYYAKKDAACEFSPVANRQPVSPRHEAVGAFTSPKGWGTMEASRARPDGQARGSVSGGLVGNSSSGASLK